MLTWCAVGFIIWGLYRGFWVLARIFRAGKNKLIAWRAERNFVNALAGEIRANRPENAGKVLYH